MKAILFLALSSWPTFATGTDFPIGSYSCKSVKDRREPSHSFTVKISEVVVGREVLPFVEYAAEYSFRRPRKTFNKGIASVAKESENPLAVTLYLTIGADVNLGFRFENRKLIEHGMKCE